MAKTKTTSSVNEVTGHALGCPCCSGTTLEDVLLGDVARLAGPISDARDFNATFPEPGSGPGLPDLAAAHAAAKDIKLESALSGMPVPMHPGAQRYFDEKGVKKQGP